MRGVKPEGEGDRAFQAGLMLLVTARGNPKLLEHRSLSTRAGNSEQSKPHTSILYFPGVVAGTWQVVFCSEDSTAPEKATPNHCCIFLPSPQTPQSKTTWGLQVLNMKPLPLSEHWVQSSKFNSKHWVLNNPYPRSHPAHPHHTSHSTWVPKPGLPIPTACTKGWE